MIGKGRVKSKRIIRKMAGYEDTRQNNKGRPEKKELSADEKVKSLESKVKLLEAENELLAKFEMIERGMKRK